MNRYSWKNRNLTAGKYIYIYTCVRNSMCNICNALSNQAFFGTMFGYSPWCQISHRDSVFLLHICKEGRCYIKGSLPACQLCLNKRNSSETWGHGAGFELQLCRASRAGVQFWTLRVDRSEVARNCSKSDRMRKTHIYLLQRNIRPSHAFYIWASVGSKQVKQVYN